MKWVPLSCLITLFLPISIGAVEIETIRTEVGQYEVCRFAKIGGAFDLSQSRTWGVWAKTSDPGTMQFHAFRSDSPETTLSTIVVSNVEEWRFVAEELVVAAAGQLAIYSLPDLKQLRTNQLAPETPSSNPSSDPSIQLKLAAAINGNQTVVFVEDVGSLTGKSTPFPIRIGNETMTVTAVEDFKDQLVVERPMAIPHSVTEPIRTVTTESSNVTRRVPQGWYCDGWVFDELGQRVSSVFYSRSVRPKSAEITDILRRNMLNVPESMSKTGGRTNSEIVLESIPAKLTAAPRKAAGMPVVLRLVGNASDTTQPEAADEIQLSVGIGTPVGVPVSNARCVGTCASFLMGDVGFHLRVLAFDSRLADLPAPQRFQFSQPSMLLDELRPEMRFRFCDGTEDHPVKSSIPDQESDGGRTAREQEVQRLVSEKLGGRGATIEEFQAKLDRFLAEVSAEFVRVVGRQPQGIPVPYSMTASTTWGAESAPVREYTFVAWEEWTRDDLVALIFHDVIAEAGKQKADADRQSELMRLAAQQQQKELDFERRKQEEESRLMQERRDAFALATRLRMRFAIALCAVGMVGSVLVAVRRKQA